MSELAAERQSRTAARPGDAARRYLAVAEQMPLQILTSMDWRSMQPPVKRYPRRAAFPAPRPIDRLLRGGYGLTRYQWDNWPALVGQYKLNMPAAGRPLRPVPSGGGLFSAELYLIGSAPGLPVGVYHYDPAADCLDPVRPGANPAWLGLQGPGLCLIIGSVFARVASKYREFGYRLQCLDAGVLAGQLLTLIEAEGLTGEAVLRFDDERIAGLLGLDPQAESALAVVTVHGLTDHSIGPQYPTATAARPSPRTRPRPSLGTLPLTQALCAASHGTSGPGGLPRPLTPAGFASEKAIGLPKTHVRLADGTESRRTAAGRFGAPALTRQQLGAILGAAGGWSGDAGPGHALLYCVVHDVADLGGGVYVYDPPTHRLLPQAADLSSRTWSGRPPAGLLGDDRAGLFVYPVGDYDAGFAAGGDRWFQIQNIVAGIGVQRMALAAAAAGLGCRVRCAYDTDSVARLLGLPGTMRPLCQVLVGSVGQGVSYAQRL